MKILLIQPPKPPMAVGGEDFAIFEPLALEYLAAAVPEKHAVRILDMRFDHDLDRELREFRPDLVGITAYTVHVNIAKKLFASIKKFDSAIITVVGGHHATVMPDDFSVPDIDAIVSGEGVIPFRGIIECLDSGRNLQTLHPTSTAADSGPVVIASDHGAIDLDSLPLPRRELTDRYRHNYFCEWMKPLASIRTSKGCHFRCSFCALWKLTGGRYLTRKPECIVEELSTIREDNIFFADDESLLDVERMSRLADLIKESGIRKNYFLYGRSDTIVNHPELLAEWKEIGLKRVFVGLEFFRDEDLKYIRKGSTVDNNVKAVRILKELGIDIFPNFIVRPDFNREDFSGLRKFCLGLELDFIGFSVLTPLPGTELFNDVKDSLVSTNYDFFDFFHPVMPTTLPLQDFFAELITLYQRSRPLKCQLRFMAKYPLRELPGLFRLYIDLMKRLKTLHEDYRMADHA